MIERRKGPEEVGRSEAEDQSEPGRRMVCLGEGWSVDCREGIRVLDR